MPSSKKFKSLQKLQARKLKEMCRDAGMKVSGTKDQLLKRLCGMEEEKPTSRMSRPKTVEEVNEWLKEQGVEDIDSVSKCLRAGIMKGYIKVCVKNPLDKVIVSDSCYHCGTDIDVTIRDVLYQPDMPGGDCVSNSQDATIQCPGIDEGKDCSGDIYLSAMCCKTPHLREGKGHAHCDRCSDFGKCMGSCRKEHCARCGAHYYYDTRCSGCGYSHKDDNDDMDSEYEDNDIMRGGWLFW